MLTSSRMTVQQGKTGTFFTYKVKEIRIVSVKQGWSTADEQSDSLRSYENDTERKIKAFKVFKVFKVFQNFSFAFYQDK